MSQRSDAIEAKAMELVNAVEQFFDPKIGSAPVSPLAKQLKALLLSRQSDSNET